LQPNHLDAKARAWLRTQLGGTLVKSDF
jgi:hypothetical protein